MFKLLQLGYTVLQELCILVLLIDFNHSSQLQEEIHIAAKRIRKFCFTLECLAIVNTAWRSTGFVLIMVLTFV